MKMYCIVFNKHGKLEALDSLQVRESDHIIMEVSKDFLYMFWTTTIPHG